MVAKRAMDETLKSKIQACEMKYLREVACTTEETVLETQTSENNN
jgi:hypothetical protein